MVSSQIIILAIIATSLATFISRFMGALTSEKVSVKSKVFQWFNCVAYSTLAALLGRMIIFPAGVLSDSELVIRLIVLITCIGIFIFTKKNLVIPTILSAIFLAIHSIFLGIKFDIQIYKLMRRVVLLLFIIFEIIAQGILVYHFYKIKNKLEELINKKVLIMKVILVSILALVAILSLPILVSKGNTHFKHALEWNYFVGVVLFYLFSRFFWRRTT